MSTQLKKQSIFNGHAETQITQLPFDIKASSHANNTPEIKFGTENNGYTEGCSITLKPSGEAISANDIVQPLKGMKLDFIGKQLADSYHSNLNGLIKARKADYKAATKVEPVKDAFEAQAATLAKKLVIAQLSIDNNSGEAKNVDISNLEQAATALLAPVIAQLLFPDEDMTIAKMWVVKELAQGSLDLAKWGFEQMQGYLKTTDAKADNTIDYTVHNPMEQLNALLDIAREQSGTKWKTVEIETLKTIDAFKALESATGEFNDARETLNTFAKENFIPSEKAYYEHIQNLKAQVEAELTQQTDEIQHSDVIQTEDRALNFDSPQNNHFDPVETDTSFHVTTPELLSPHQPTVELNIMTESLDFSM